MAGYPRDHDHNITKRIKTEFDLSSQRQNQGLRSMALHKRLLQSGISPFLLEWSNWNTGEIPLKTKIFILAMVIISSSNGNWPKDVLASLGPILTSGHVSKPDTRLLKKWKTNNNNKKPQTKTQTFMLKIY